MDVVTVLERLCRHGHGRTAIEVDLLMRAEGFNDTIKPLPRPVQLLTKLVDEHPVAAGAHPGIEVLQVALEGVGLDEPCLLFLVVEPGAQGLTYGGVARRFAPMRSVTPVEIAVEALHELGRQADTHNL